MFHVALLHPNSQNGSGIAGQLSGEAGPFARNSQKVFGAQVGHGTLREGVLGPEAVLVPVPPQVFGLGAGGFGGNGQWLPFIGLEVLAHGRFGEMVPERRGADKA